MADFKEKQIEGKLKETGVSIRNSDGSYKDTYTVLHELSSAFNESEEVSKIKVSSAKIVVHGTVDKPYYEIKYCTLDGECHIGYSSYDLKNVFGWLKECFEIVTATEVEHLDTRKHGNWFLLDECSNTGVYCSICHKKVYKSDYANQKIKSKFCPNCGAIMDGKFEKY